VTATDSCGTQILSDTITVFAPDFPPLEVNLDDTAVCLEGSLLLTPVVTGGNGDYSYSWSTGDTASSLYLTPQADSVYSLIVTDQCNTTINAQSLVGIQPQPSADFNYTITENNETILANTSINGAVYFWDFGDGGSSTEENPTHYYSQPGLYTVSLYVYNQYNCGDTVTYVVDIITVQKFYVPNILDLNSMNQDNNRLYVFGEGIETLSFSIYDRWGEIVYQTSDASISLRGDGLCCAYGEGWDGTYNNTGKSLNTSVLAYQLEGRFINGEAFMESGNITLIK
jgi:PKD repeat protein